jgi:FKBP-type peptidyl-prolyl cis-trans isomerase
MKTIKLLIALLSIVALSSCHTNDWMDWKHQNEIWLLKNKQKDSVEITPTGLQYKCIEKGEIHSSAHVDDAKIVSVKYTGRLINGYIFDSSERYEGYVSSFVPGFSEGLKKMKEFGVYEFYIPFDLAYGVEGTGTEGTSSHIPPYSTLIFRVELLDVY